MGNVELIAVSAFPYADKSLKSGDAFMASERDAKTLTLLGKARYSTKDLPPVSDASQDAASLPRVKRRYHRRDLTAQS